MKIIAVIFKHRGCYQTLDKDLYNCLLILISTRTERRFHYHLSFRDKETEAEGEIKQLTGDLYTGRMEQRQEMNAAV